MGKIDTMEWGEFHLYDIFSISMGNKFDRSKMCEVDEGINFVGRSALTNGVACAVTSVEDKKGNTVQPYPAGDITIALGGSIGAAFVQDREFYTSQNVCVLHTDDPSITERVKWFVAASITASCGNYEAFTDELNRHIRTDFTIRLPVDKTGQPDWAYMESYMANLETKVAESMTMLQAAKDAEKEKVDTREWGEFCVGELFKTQMKGKKIQVPTGANVPMQDMIQDGSTPRITVTGVNNGVFGLYDYCGKNSTEYRVFRNFISVSFLGTVFYQEGEATLDMKVHCLQPNHITLNKYTGNFLVSAIKASLRESSYSDQISSTILPEMTIMLPKDKTGQPDWAYMEEYMRKVEEKVENVLNHFEKDRNGV